MALNSNNTYGSGPKDVEKFWDYISAAELADWTVTAVSAGTIAGRVASPCANGVARLSGAATTDDSGYQRQTYPIVDLEANQYAVCAQRASLGNSATLGDYLMGFCIIDTSLIASAPTDGIYLMKATAGTAMVLHVCRDSSDVTFTVDAAVDTAFHTWAIEVEARGGQSGQITVYKDGKIIHQAIYANIPDDEVMAYSSAWQSGSAAGTQYVDVDWDRVRIKRVDN